VLGEIGRQLLELDEDTILHGITPAGSAKLP
jgi:hypothetical protein